MRCVRQIKQHRHFIFDRIQSSQTSVITSAPFQAAALFVISGCAEQCSICQVHDNYVSKFGTTIRVVLVLSNSWRRRFSIQYKYRIGTLRRGNFIGNVRSKVRIILCLLCGFDTLDSNPWPFAWCSESALLMGYPEYTHLCNSCVCFLERKFSPYGLVVSFYGCNGSVSHWYLYVRILRLCLYLQCVGSHN